LRNCKYFHEYVLKKTPFNLRDSISNSRFPTYQQNKFFEEYIDTPFYCDVRGGEMVIYDRYLEFKNKYNNLQGFNKIIEKISLLINNDELNKFGDSSNINIAKRNLDFPMFRKEMTYGIDLGFLVLNNLKIEKKTDSLGGIKDGNFTGSIIKNTRFTNYNFSICKFIAVEYDNVIFENCNFRECYFYKNKGEGKVTYVNCTYNDQYTIDQLNEQFE
jgi:hypothetical protein